MVFTENFTAVSLNNYDEIHFGVPIDRDWESNQNLPLWIHRPCLPSAHVRVANHFNGLSVIAQTIDFVINLSSTMECFILLQLNAMIFRRWLVARIDN